MYKFGKFDISAENEVFFESKYTMGLVNLKPITPGHVLVVPKRVVLRYSQLTTEEVTDLTESAKRIASVLASQYAEAKNGCLWLIQDGQEAGQTVPHVHLHLIPKRFSEWPQENDSDRMPRPLEEMRKEAKQLRINFD